MKRRAEARRAVLRVPVTGLEKHPACNNATTKAVWTRIIAAIFSGADYRQPARAWSPRGRPNCSCSLVRKTAYGTVSCFDWN